MYFVDILKRYFKRWRKLAFFSYISLSVWLNGFLWLYVDVIFLFSVCSSHVDPDLCWCLVQWSHHSYFGYVYFGNIVLFLNWCIVVFFLSVVTCQNMALFKMCSFFRSHRSFQLASGLWKASGTSIWLVFAMMTSVWVRCRGTSVYYTSASVSKAW